MENNDVTVVSKNVINRVSKNEYGEISAEISQESADQLIAGLSMVAGQIASSAFESVAQIYANALMRQERLELKSLMDEAECMRRFNNQVDKAMEKLDFSQPGIAENFEKVCETLRKNLLTELQSKHRPSLLDKLFRRA